MRFGKNIEEYKNLKQKTFFAWFPYSAGGETRWLEKVTVHGYYYLGYFSDTVQFMPSHFIDTEIKNKQI